MFLAETPVGATIHQCRASASGQYNKDPESNLLIEASAFRLQPFPPQDLRPALPARCAESPRCEPHWHWTGVQQRRVRASRVRDAIDFVLQPMSASARLLGSARRQATTPSPEDRRRKLRNGLFFWREHSQAPRIYRPPSGPSSARKAAASPFRVRWRTKSSDRIRGRNLICRDPPTRSQCHRVLDYRSRPAFYRF